MKQFIISQFNIKFKIAVVLIKEKLLTITPFNFAVK